jgi:hypothetical protein
MARYLVPVTYEVYGHVTIEANSPEEAIKIAKRTKYIPDDIECSSSDTDFACGEDPDDVELDVDEEEVIEAFKKIEE